MPIPPFLILDLDDTILDYSAPAEKIWPRLYREYAPRMKLPVERLQQAVDESRRWYWSDADRFREGRLDLKRARRIFVRDALDKLGLAEDGLADRMADEFTLEREGVVRPFDGAIEALTLFQERGAKMVLLTNGESSMQRAKIERFGLACFFKSIRIEGETGIGKPDPRAHRAALAALDAPPQYTWMIGDDWEFDVAPAQALGMRTAWIREPAKTEERTADLIIPSLGVLAEHWKRKRMDPSINKPENPDENGSVEGKTLGEMFSPPKKPII
jgi:putative hydrolase of the HAD superfamily